MCVTIGQLLHNWNDTPSITRQIGSEIGISTNTPHLYAPTSLKINVQSKRDPFVLIPSAEPWMDQINKGFQAGLMHSLLENPKILYWPQHLVDRSLGPVPRMAKSKKRNFNGYCGGIQGILATVPFLHGPWIKWPSIRTQEHNSVLTCVPHYYATRSDLISSSWKRVDFGQRRERERERLSILCRLRAIKQINDEITQAPTTSQ